MSFMITVQYRHPDYGCDVYEYFSYEDAVIDFYVLFARMRDRGIDPDTARMTVVPVASRYVLGMEVVVE